MAPGSVIVDMAAEQGGNCPLTERDKVVEKHGVTMIGLTDLPSRMARQASELYAVTVLNLLKEMYTRRQGRWSINLDDEIQRGAIVLHDGELMWPPPPSASRRPRPRGRRRAGRRPTAPRSRPPRAAPATCWPRWRPSCSCVAGIFGPPEFLQHLTVFLLACVVGWHVIWNVSPALHTPLMSVTNAISGIIVIGGMLVLYGGGEGSLGLGGAAILLAAINVAGGFLVTQRMLRMFRK